MQKFTTSGVLGAVLSLATLASPSIANGASIDSDFQVEIDFGPLTGNIYSGNISYDDSNLTGSGDETLPLTNFNFIFDGNSYTLADDTNATATFLNGKFLGIDYSFTGNPFPSFTFTSGTDNVFDALFSYNLGGPSLAGTGVISYSVAPIPEPLSIMGAGMALGFGSFFKRKLSRSKSL